MKKTLASVLVAGALAAPAMAAPVEYNIDPRHTFPVFEVNHLGFSTQRGRFNKTEGRVVLDREAKQGSVELTIDVESLDMGFETWDEHMADEGFFDTARHPTITFKSNKLIFDGDKVVGAEGHLTLLGVTRPVKLKVENFTCKPHPMLKKEACGADISTVIKRSEFGMTKLIPAVGDEVRIYSPVEAIRKD
ncbi:MAG: YceI family protein [Pseudomonadota bacterium]|nr:MAG: polyisoprenoid-binding protein [Pseudomonadota bacterium]